jgi:hypothetical protein
MQTVMTPTGACELLDLAGKRQVTDGGSRILRGSESDCVAFDLLLRQRGKLPLHPIGTINNALHYTCPRRVSS